MGPNLMQLGAKDTGFFFFFLLDVNLILINVITYSKLPQIPLSHELWTTGGPQTLL